MQFLKLGGSLITEKQTPHTLCPERLNRICAEISHFIDENPQEKLLIGHGSGSFGHVPASEYGTRSGVKSTQEWTGFHKVWQEARALNALVVDSLIANEVQAVSFAPSSTVTPSSSEIWSWNLEPVRASVRHGLIPVVYGDVVFDLALGGTILSTEELFAHLARKMEPTRILLAGLEAGVWADFPDKRHLIEKISPSTFAEQKKLIQGSASTDVTGGMISKVEQMLKLVTEIPGLQVVIFSGVPQGSVYDFLSGKPGGTLICADDKKQ